MPQDLKIWEALHYLMEVKDRYKMTMILVEGHPNLYRDEKTGAIINYDQQGYNQY